MKIIQLVEQRDVNVATSAENLGVNYNFESFLIRGGHTFRKPLI